MSTAMIVDGQNLLMRAIFAAHGAHMSSGGVPTGPLLIFINSLAKHVQEEQPDRLTLVWDGGTSAERVRVLPSYKANRKPVPSEEKTFRDSTSELARRFLALAGVFQVQVTGVEADDLVASAWSGMRDPDIGKIVILSSDKDFMQLLGTNPHGIETELVRLSSAGTPTDRWDARRVHDEFGYAPWNWPLVTALAGDKSDGVPGLPGIGPVKALKLLRGCDWDLGKIELSAEHREIAQACYDVVNLRGLRAHPIGIPPWRPTDFGSVAWTELINFLDAYEMRSVKDRLQARTLWSNRDLINVTQGDEEANGGGA